MAKTAHYAAQKTGRIAYGLFKSKLIYATPSSSLEEVVKTAKHLGTMNETQALYVTMQKARDASGAKISNETLRQAAAITPLQVFVGDQNLKPVASKLSKVSKETHRRTFTFFNGNPVTAKRRESPAAVERGYRKAHELSGRSAIVFPKDSVKTRANLLQSLSDNLW